MRRVSHKLVSAIMMWGLVSSDVRLTCYNKLYDRACECERTRSKNRFCLRHLSCSAGKQVNIYFCVRMCVCVFVYVCVPVCAFVCVRSCLYVCAVMHEREREREGDGQTCRHT